MAMHGAADASPFWKTCLTLTNWRSSGNSLRRGAIHTGIIVASVSVTIERGTQYQRGDARCTRECIGWSLSSV
jgi:hypothetical protein